MSRFRQTVRFSCVLLCALVSGCAHFVTISYPPEAVIHPEFNKPYTILQGERVKVDWMPSLRAESFEYLAEPTRVLLADSIHQRGLHKEYKTAGKGTPLVTYAKNPEKTPEEHHYPTSGLVLGITAVEEKRRGQVTLLKLYDALDSAVVRSSRGTDPIAANYTAILAVLYSQARKVAGSAGASFLRPDNPRFATGIYLIHPYDPNKVPILFVHGLLSSPISWQILVNDLCADPDILEHYQPWFFLYPTGQPVLESAAQLREDLQATQRLFDPPGTSIPSHHVIVVAHSMGGLLAHTLESDSGDTLWNVFATRPLHSLSLSASEKDTVLRYFFFRHQAAIDRIIFLSVPHRGSRLADGILGSIGNRLIRHSRSPAQAVRELAAQYPGILSPYVARVNPAVAQRAYFRLRQTPC